MVPWAELVLFMLSVEFLALYGLAVSGHFPAEFRAPEMSKGHGAVMLWATIVLAALAAVTTLSVGAQVLPWYTLVIGGGMMLLFAPLLLRVFPDRFVNGSAALLTFAGGAIGTTMIMWIIA